MRSIGRTPSHWPSAQPRRSRSIGNRRAQGRSRGCGARRAAGGRGGRCDLAGRYRRPGRLHPISQTLDEVIAIFGEMGFSVAEGPDIEDDFHNFEALNIPPEHPARQMHDTFYLPEKGRIAQCCARIPRRYRFAPWRTKSPDPDHRAGADLSLRPGPHSRRCSTSRRPRGRYDVAYGTPQRLRIEFCRAYFEVDDVPVRFRPSYFPFTEPRPRWIPAVRATGTASRLARATIGSRSSAAAWCTQMCCAPAVSIPMSIKVSLLACGQADRDVEIRHPGFRTFFEADLRWLRHYGFMPMEVPTMLRGLTP